MANQLATPGLGSLVARRWLAGTGQLLLALAGFTLVLVWFVQMMIRYYGLMFGETQLRLPKLALLEAGAILFALSWFWAAVTSFSLLREASRNSLKSLESLETEPIPPPVLDLSGKPPKQP
jgi:DMSO/TMAO reductase YedYZ heme-binding membrane subunit